MDDGERFEHEFVSSRFDQILYDPLRRRRLERSLAAIAVLCVVTIGALIAVALTGNEEPWSPFGPFPTQDVLDRDLIIDVSVGAIRIEGTKCREGTAGVQRTGSWNWRQVRPPGFASTLNTSAAVIAPNGCETNTFNNAIPPEVVAEVCRNGSSEWHVVGSETPIGDVLEDGTIVAREGLTLGWESEIFTLTCERPTL